MGLTVGVFGGVEGLSHGAYASSTDIGEAEEPSARPAPPWR
jgi:hypothetical protein